MIAFRRGRGINVTVLSGFAFPLPETWGSIVLRSHDGRPDTVSANTTMWLERDLEVACEVP